MTKKVYRIKFHGVTQFYGENPENAVAGFRSQAETASEDFIIDSVEEVSREEIEAERRKTLSQWTGKDLIDTIARLRKLKMLHPIDDDYLKSLEEEVLRRGVIKKE